MKTHELAKALTHLSRVLRAGPNVEFEELTNLSTYLSQPKPSRPSRDAPERSDRSEKGTGLALLAEMANYSKKELGDLIEMFGIPIEMKKTESVRDVLGRMLNYIKENPDFRDKILHEATGSRPEAKTSSLARALAILMNQP